MLNNKGQTLVLFVLLLPIILIILTNVINYGKLSFEKQKIENNIKSALEYGLKLKVEKISIEDGLLSNDEIKNKLDYLIKQNIEVDYLRIEVDDNSIFIKIEKNNKILFNLFSNKINISYFGKIENDKYLIERR